MWILIGIIAVLAIILIITYNSYAKHESGTLTKVTELRRISSLSGSDKIGAYQQMDSIVKGLTLQAEAYPELQASSNYMHLQKTINDLEEKLSASRRTYNARVNRYNTMIETFPTVIFTGMLKFTRKDMLVVEEAKLNQLLNLCFPGIKSVD
jgi:LemA protein